MSMKRTTTRAEAHRWEFKARFRRQAFGRESQPAIQRVKQAAGTIGRAAETKDRIRRIVGNGPDRNFVASVLGRDLGIGS
jgi:hypothetical protein